MSAPDELSYLCALVSMEMDLISESSSDKSLCNKNLGIYTAYFISSSCPLGRAIKQYSSDQDSANILHVTEHAIPTDICVETGNYPLTIHSTFAPDLIHLQPLASDAMYSLDSLRKDICSVEDQDLLEKSNYSKFTDDMMKHVSYIAPQVFMVGILGHSNNGVCLGTKEGVHFGKYFDTIPASDVNELNSRLDVAFLERLYIDTYLEGYVQYTDNGDKTSYEIDM